MAYNAQLKKSDGSLYEDVYVATKWSLINDKPSTFTPTSHNHDDRYFTETEVDTKLGGKANTSHSHNDIYYTETEVDTKLGGKANTSHNHTKSQITDFPTTMTPTAHSHTKSEITDFPTAMPPTAHNHDDRYYTETEVDTKLGGYLSNSHPASDVTAGKIGNWNTAYTQISKSKSYAKTISPSQWVGANLECVVSVPGLKTSDTVILDGDNEIFAEYGLDAVIGTGTLTFSVGVKPSKSITIKYSIIKTGSGT